MAKFIRVKTVPGQSDTLMQERDYYVNLDLITIVSQSPHALAGNKLRL